MLFIVSVDEQRQPVFNGGKVLKGPREHYESNLTPGHTALELVIRNVQIPGLVKQQ